MNRVGVKSLLLSLFAAVTLSAGIVFADEPAEKGKIDIQISPTKTSIKEKMTPGEVCNGVVKVSNIGTDSFSYQMSASPYSVEGDQYEQNYNPTESAYNMMHSWISFPEEEKNGVLQPNEEKTVHYTITVPLDVPAGGQYAVIFAQTEDSIEEKASVKTVSRVGSKIYGVVDGETRSGGEVIKNYIPSFILTTPLTVSSTVNSNGNIEQEEEIIFTVKGFFSGDVKYTETIKKSIMPETSRSTSLDWKDAPALGIFKVSQEINYAGQHNIEEKTVIICPLWLIAVILILIIFMVYWLIIRKRTREDSKKLKRV